MEIQLKMDGRVSPDALYERRKLVANLHRKGMKVIAIVETMGMSWKAVRKAIDLYEAGGVQALRPKRRGVRKGSSRMLTPEQERQVQRDICDKRPEADAAGAPEEDHGAYGHGEVVAGEGEILLRGRARGLRRRINLIYCRSNSAAGE